MTHISQRHLIHSTSWDILIILDACRYDYFKEEAPSFFDERPLRVYSSGDGTIQWIKKTWTKKHPELTYFMSNPTMRNGVGARLGDWNPLEHFGEVVELWKTHWGKFTVHPREVVDEFIKRGSPVPAILHFNQPHYPYLGETKFKISEELMSKFRGNEKAYPAARNTWIIENKLTATLRRAYRENLRIVLGEVKRLADVTPNARVVITADHGEWLGEGDRFFHTDGNVNCPILRDVPWLRN